MSPWGLLTWACAVAGSVIVIGLAAAVLAAVVNGIWKGKNDEQH